MINSSLNEIKKKLEEVESLENRRSALSGFSLFLIVAAITIIVYCFLELVFGFTSTVRTILFYLIVAACFALFSNLVIIPLLRSFFVLSKPDYSSTSKKIGLAFSDIKDELLNAIEILTLSIPGYSSDLINAAFERIYKKSESIDFKTSVDFSKTKKQLGFTAAGVFLVSILIIIIPGFSSSAYRIINYSKNFTPPQKFYFQLIPGNKEVTKGDGVSIVVSISGDAPAKISLMRKSAEQTEFEESLLNADESGKSIYKVSEVKSSFEYFAAAEGVKSDVYKISVINRPIITQLDVIITPPAYSGLPQTIQRDNGNISALPGSKISLGINSSRELSNATIMFSDNVNRRMSVLGQKADTDFAIYKSLTYSINIIDYQNIANINPITYSIQKLEDRLPSIEMITPKESVKLGTDGKISIITKVSDDYGFSSLQLNYQLTTSRYREAAQELTQVPIPIKKESVEDEVYYVWDLTPLFLAEGEALSFFMEVFDNDIVSGPKSARTPTLSILIPSLDDLYKTAENTQQEASKDLSETLKEAEKLSRELKNISDDLKQNSRDVSWQEKERVEKASQRFSELMQKTDDAAKKLDEMRRDLMQNNLLSEETLQKYNELQDLLDQLNSEELREAFKRMQESLQNMMRDNVQMSLEELKANEEYFKKSLERTLNLLKRIQIEQKLDELIKRTEDISEKLEELSQKTSQSNLNEKNKRDELTNRQNDLTKDIERMSAEMKNLDQKMSEMSDMPKEEMEKLLNEFENQKNVELSEEILKELKQMRKLEALKNQQQLSQNIQNAKSQMQSLQSALQQMNQMRTFFEMMKILDDLLTLSKTQEDLKNNTFNLAPLSPETNRNSREQSDIQNNLSKILQKMSALSQKTFAITPEMGRSLGRAYSEMQQSITLMQNGNPAGSSQKQTEAMKYLNEAATLMKGGMDQMMSGGQGGGMMSMMQQLQQMSQQQMDLNQLTQMLNQGRMTQEMMSQMQRIAQQQEIIRKSLEQLNRESQETGQSKRLATNLEKILEEMREVVSNLQSQKLDDELLKKQERILSKLLDAQRSINERDFENERRSNTGKNVARTSPPELMLSTEEGRNKLRDEFMKAIREGYKKDYEELIRKYFEALEKEKQ
jgi:hypothetical protein